MIGGIRAASQYSFKFFFLSGDRIICPEGEATHKMTKKWLVNRLETRPSSFSVLRACITSNNTQHHVYALGASGEKHKLSFDGKVRASIHRFVFNSRKELGITVGETTTPQYSYTCVKDVQPGSLAEKHGIFKGDIISKRTDDGRLISNLSEWIAAVIVSKQTFRFEVIRIHKISLAAEQHAGGLENDVKTSQPSIQTQTSSQEDQKGGEQQKQEKPLHGSGEEQIQPTNESRDFNKRGHATAKSVSVDHSQNEIAVQEETFVDKCEDLTNQNDDTSEVEADARSSSHDIINLATSSEDSNDNEELTNQKERTSELEADATNSSHDIANLTHESKRSSYETHKNGPTNKVSRQLYQLGTEIWKRFLDEETGKKKAYRGEVVGYDSDEGYYKILYDDG